MMYSTNREEVTGVLEEIMLPRILMICILRQMFLGSSHIYKCEWGGKEECAALMREMRNANKTFVRKPEGKRPLGRPRHR
jgi:hypothetical protein